ncbi:DUF7927 domain-containing protein [Nocardioides limicola]|uniref:DUF7927 domain-containing protein n=1 Tax=Nocardioides limicola TaxID=2803368 RepID=UPI00193C6B36|nr:DUF11 domain-containing protein [Nocardioides sp. DJM-14]
MLWLLSLLLLAALLPAGTANAAEEPTEASVELAAAGAEVDPTEVADAAGEEAVSEADAQIGAEDEAAIEAEVEGAAVIAEVETSTGEAAVDTDATAEADADARALELAAQQAGPPVYEITGSWLNAPTTIGRGEPVVAEWRVNVNDSAEPPANEPVENVTVEFTLTHALFDSIPDICRTTDVEPVSSITNDGRTLVCNLGTVAMGTAVVVQTPVVADGATGDQITHDGTIDGQTVALPPIEILNDFRMDIYYGQNTNRQNWTPDIVDPTASTVDIQWTLRLGTGSDVGPDSVTYSLNVTAADGSPVSIGSEWRQDIVDDLGLEGDFTGGCTPHAFGGAEGHPFSARPDLPARNANFVDTCTLTQTGPSTFALTLTGIDYSLLPALARDSANTSLDPDWVYVAAGSLFFEVDTDAAGSINLVSSAPTYTSVTGLEFTDIAANNTTNKSYTLPGSWAASWRRGFTGSGGTQWDDTYRVPSGTVVQAQSLNTFRGGTESGAYGSCVTLDTAFGTYVPGSAVVMGQDAAAPHAFHELDTAPYDTMQWYVGPQPADPDQFSCQGAAGWVSAEPADPTTVHAVRATWDYSRYSIDSFVRLGVWVQFEVDPTLPTGQDVWMFGGVLQGDGQWAGPASGNAITSTPDARYPNTTGRRDILRTVSVQPTIVKSAAQATVTPGVPAEFTLTYAATGSAMLPPTVDGFQIIDTLPLGMTYEPGSADPEPVVSESMGQQVLTWTLDGVPTNVSGLSLTYAAVADSSVEPGSRLTNVAYASYDGADSRLASATVSLTTNGHTLILKTADVDYIPNRMGDGVGTGSWTIRIDSFDPLPQAFTDTIDILPYNGDGRGTSFSGSYALDEVVLPDGGIVYYTDADPATLTDDPADPANGSAGDPSGNTVGWTTTPPASPTAIRVIGAELAPGESFAFGVVITTEGAQPQDVYWNRAQARAEHTELVMRTSAPLVVTDYHVVKSSDPESGSVVNPGDVITYTITVTQVGDVPAGAVLSDDLSAVLDDAVYNDDVAADLGTVALSGDMLTWEGEVPVGGTATITYSVTVKELEDLQADGDAVLTNVVASPGCRMPEHCTTTHSAGRYEFSKTADPAPGSEVHVGDVITYTVRIAATVGAVPGATITDDLTEVLDDAVWNDDVDATNGSATLAGTSLTWTGDLGVGEVVTLTYSVTVTEGGDRELRNVVTSADERSVCAPAEDGNTGCATTHDLTDRVAAAGALPDVGGPSWLPALLAAALVGLGLLMVGFAGGSRRRPSLG